MKKLIITLLACSPLFASAQEIQNYAENLTPFQAKVLGNLSAECERLLDAGRYQEALQPCDDFAGALMSVRPIAFRDHIAMGYVTQPYGFCGSPENNPELCSALRQASRTS
ncbi:hypothetical protein DFO67_1341, partial [Modicisalibacter xianhensis]